MTKEIKPLPHQERALAHIQDQKQSGLFLDMGLGKTYTSLFLAQRSKMKKILIVCQGSKLTDWHLQTGDIFKGVPIGVLFNGTSKDPKLMETLDEIKDNSAHESNYKLRINTSSDIQIVISTYTTQMNRDALLMKHNWLDKDTFVIVDESQKYKNRTGKLGKYGVKLSNKVGKLVLLSGDPISNGYEDLYNQMVMLGMDMKYKTFEDNFLITKMTKLPNSRFPFPEIVGYKNVDLLMNALKSQAVFMKKEEVLDLPEQIWTDIHLEHEKLKDVKKIVKDRVHGEIMLDSMGALNTGIRQLASGFLKDETNLGDHKKKALEDLLSSTKENFVIWYVYNQELEDIKEVAAKLNIKVFEMNGSTKNTDDRHNYEGRKLIVSQYQSGASGQNWQDFNYMLYYSPTDSGSDYRQSIARIHRLGQKKTCFYYRFIVNGMLDKKRYASQSEKKEYSDRMFIEDFEKLHNL